MEAIGIGLVVAWLLGEVSGYTLGNFVYVLLALGIVLLVTRLVGASRVV